MRDRAARITIDRAYQEWRSELVSVVDVPTRERVALEGDTSFASRRVTGVLERIVAQRGSPERTRSDNGPELTTPHYLAWGIGNKIELKHIRPGRPMQNGPIESVNGRFRDKC